LQGINVGRRFDVTIQEIDVAPVQVQGPKSVDVIADLVGEEARTLPSFGLMEAQVGGRDVIISQTGFTGEKGYEIYLKEATKYAEDMWNAVLEAGVPYNLKVVAPSHHRRIAAGILAWGPAMDFQALPFQVNRAYPGPSPGGRIWMSRPCRSRSTWPTRCLGRRRPTTSARLGWRRCGSRSRPGSRRIAPSWSVCWSVASRSRTTRRTSGSSPPQQRESPSGM